MPYMSKIRQQTKDFYNAINIQISNLEMTTILSKIFFIYELILWSNSPPIELNTKIIL